jgi:hypothetical protein
MVRPGCGKQPGERNHVREAGEDLGGCVVDARLSRTRFHRYVIKSGI